MKENIISIEIEGDYLSSFIYSGVLILVDSDFNLTTYSWSEVISQALSGYNSQQQFLLKGYFENSRSSKIPEGFQNNILLVKESALSLSARDGMIVSRRRREICQSEVRDSARGRLKFYPE
ncbi:hypothetical protein BMR07_03080 [Methylococcaceae bacterium CS1]|nr:hypothetical protein BMR07_03080 [Methylococcaceae bacterium CS1]TXL11227.1 hypothetical protein BMR08_05275 [Methylococcaceae bacterium CS2]